MKNLSVKPETLKLLEEKVGQIQDTGLGKDFLNGPEEVSNRSAKNVNN